MILDLAKAVPIETEIARRGIRLTGNRSERVGPCPIRGGRDRFSINTMKGLWHCRGCSRGGDVIPAAAVAAAETSSPLYSTPTASTSGPRCACSPAPTLR